MKFLILGDFHRNPKRPRSRLDDYGEAQDKKLKYVMDFAYHAPTIDCIVQVGDMFEEANGQPLHFINSTVDLLAPREYGLVQLFTIRGNHDVPFRSINSTNTAYSVLERTGVIKTLNDRPHSFKGVDFYGVSYGEDIPKVNNKDKFNVLVTHVGISKDAPKFEMSEPWYASKEYLQKCKEYNLVCAGHNHTHLVDTYRGRTLIQPGSLMRSTIAQTEHEPCFYVFDTEENYYEQHFIPISPADEVFDIASHEQKKEQVDQLVTFAEGFNEDVELDLDFRGNVQNMIHEQNVSDDVVEIINICMEGE